MSAGWSVDKGIRGNKSILLCHHLITASSFISCVHMRPHHSRHSFDKRYRNAFFALVNHSIVSSFLTILDLLKVKNSTSNNFNMKTFRSATLRPSLYNFTMRLIYANFNYFFSWKTFNYSNTRKNVLYPLKLYVHYTMMHGTFWLNHVKSSNKIALLPSKFATKHHTNYHFRHPLFILLFCRKIHTSLISIWVQIENDWSFRWAKSWQLLFCFNISQSHERANAPLILLL